MTDVTEDAALQPVVAAELLSLAGLLSTMSAEQWDTPSLCAGWRVREVVAHMTMAARYSEEEFMAELKRCGFDFTRLSNEVAARDAGLPVDELVGNLRSEVMLHWAPPGGGYHGALNHAVIHGLDVTEPLGVGRLSPDDTIRIILGDLTQGETHGQFGIDIARRRLEATDLDWSFGAGPVLRGPAADLALVLCGRSVPPGRLDGAPLARLPGAGRAAPMQWFSHPDDDMFSAKCGWGDHGLVSRVGDRRRRRGGARVRRLSLQRPVRPRGHRDRRGRAGSGGRRLRFKAHHAGPG